MKKFWSSLRVVLVYTVVCIVYLGMLHNLNNKLNAVLFNSSLELLLYNNYQPIKYFIVALVLAFIGGYIAYRKFLILRSEVHESEDKLFGALAILIIAVMLVAILIGINVPILRAIFTVLIVGGLFISGVTQ